MTLHREGLLAHRSLRSLERARGGCVEAGLRVEVVAVLDQADAATRELIDRDRAALGLDEVVEVDVGDPGLARNAGIEKCRGEFVALLDADDLFSRNWLASAHSALARDSARAILHPEINFNFGARRHWWRSPAQNDPDFCVGNLIHWNYWSVLAFTRRVAFVEIPFVGCPRGSGFGYEDWHWTTRTIAAGWEHRVVPGTVHFIRAKEGGGVVRRHFEERVVVRPSEFFDRRVFARYAPPRQDAGERSLASVGVRLGGRLRHSLFLAAQAIDHATFSFVADETPPAVSRALYRGRKLVLSAWTGGIGRRGGLPDWVVAELQGMAALEPSLYPDSELLERTPPLPLPRRTTQASAYAAALEAVGEEPVSHVLLGPWLTRGGADLSTLLLATAAAGDHRRTVVVTTEDAPSPWASRLPPGVAFVPLGEMGRGLHVDEVANVLVRLLLQLRPAVVHNVNSRAGWLVFGRHGGPLTAGGGRLFGSLFTHDLTREGRPAGYFQDLPAAWPHLSALCSDNEHYLEYLHATFGYERTKLWCVRHPVTPFAPADRWRAQGDRRPILWAGRLARQKRPDLLAAVADALPDREVHVFGDSDGPLGYPDMLALRRRRNVKLRGPYDGFASLRPGAYDLLLYTSEWDGMPNVVLEGAAAGIPVVASAVGGVPELLTDDTGFPVHPFDDVGAYVAAIRAIEADPSGAARRSERARAVVERDYTWDRFVARLRELPGWFG